MPRRRKRPEFRVVAVMDTETCNLDMAGEHVAYPILYICNEFAEVNITDYVADCPGEHVSYFRDVEGCLSWFESLIELADGYIPVCCFYNMNFDIYTLYDWISNAFDDVHVCAQSGANFYYLDLVRDGRTAIRLWDTYHLEMGGLKAMGATCGLAKATGDWDYGLTRTPETPLTADELFYAKRDVQVIPAYLRYLLSANPHLKPSDLGSTVLTKTGLARVMAKKLFHNSIMCPDGKRRNPQMMYLKRCEEEKPKTYLRYALRKACFQGGLTFTAGKAAFRTWNDVASFDVVSMHHTFCNGRYLPINFRPIRPEDLQFVLKRIVSTPLSYVLSHYEQPFVDAIHARVYFKNMRLREGSVFEEQQIGVVAETKFYRKVPTRSDIADNDLNLAAEESARMVMGNSCRGGRFAFSKLLSCDECVLHVTELELWTLAQAYEWDGMLALFGEYTGTFHPMETQATLMSNILFKQKQAMKAINSRYDPGTPYPYDIDPVVPSAIAEGVRKGELSGEFVHNYYTSTVKGLFNSAGYGVHAQDEWKPDFLWQDGAKVDADSTLTPDSFEESVTKGKSKVLYTLGMRIVGGSRMHLAIAMMLVHQTGSLILDGDTDSMKVALNGNSVEDVLEALQPLHRATRDGIDRSQRYVRAWFPQMASDLKDVGTFEYEDKVGVMREYFPAWNKARAYLDSGGQVHVVLAGVSRPEGRMNIATWIRDRMAQGLSFNDVCLEAFGFGSEMDPSVSNALEKAVPEPHARFDADVTDYTGITSRVSAYRCIALYDSARDVNDASKLMNRQNMDYLREHEGLAVADVPACVAYEGGVAVYRKWFD